ncbi:MAG TPA: hypothetical protein VNA57_09775 [Acidimicrobiales bacterium]|nr:hypothetical protein [Acidimicrobiales bacterium]
MPDDRSEHASAAGAPGASGPGDPGYDGVATIGDEGASAGPESFTEPFGRPRPRPRRYRCTSCGNLTRFDVTMTRRTRAFHHYTVGGELTVEDEQVLEEKMEQVSCRWCGTGGTIEELQGAEG